MMPDQRSARVYTLEPHVLAAIHAIGQERMVQLMERGHTIDSDDTKFTTGSAWLEIMDEHLGKCYPVFDEVTAGDAPPDDMRQGFVIIGALAAAAIEWYNRREHDKDQARMRAAKDGSG